MSGSPDIEMYGNGCPIEWVLASKLAIHGHDLETKTVQIGYQI